MATQLAMVIDASRCLDCKACQAACKVANQVPEGRWRNWIKSQDIQKAAAERKPAVFQPGNCMQCSNATCVQACPTGATYKDPKDGVVKIDTGLCIGCGQCLPSCPYGARYRHPEKRVADKCDFCAQRRADGLEPACVSTCPTKARVFGDLNDPESMAAKLYKEQKPGQVVNQVSNTDPNIYYVGDPGDKNWPQPARMPAAHQTFKNLAGPAVKIMVGLSGLGVLAMLGKQLFLKDEPPEHQEAKGGSDE
jgi:Fe-S-cluster-containing dehydrogenase component